MKNIDGSTIDDLLGVVDDVLLAGYAQKHGRSLKWANAAYKMVCRDRDALSRKGSILYWSYAMGVVFMAFADAIPGFLGLTALMIIWMVLVWKEMKDNAETATKYQRMLAEFRAAVEGLYSEYSVSRIVDEYYVRIMLVKTASQLLAAQRLLEIDRHGQCSAEVLFNSCRLEAYCSREFNRKVQAAAEFGLTFKKAELFRDAAASLDGRR